MRRIPLRRQDRTVCAHALVDDEDYAELAQYRWSLSDKGYARRGARIDGRVRLFYMHRQIMGYPPLVDHIDGNPLNNQRSNLRAATRAINSQNRHRLNRNNRSGERGVSWYARTGRWAVDVRGTGRSRRLGYFVDYADAVAAARAARAEHMPFSQDAA